MGTIFIRDLIVRGIIGVNAQEREHPQDFVINIDFQTNVERAGTTDDILDSVDYQSLADRVKAHAGSVGRYTVEALAADVAEIVMADSRVDSVRVRVEKPEAVPATRSVGVLIERCRAWPAIRPSVTPSDQSHEDWLDLSASSAPNPDRSTVPSRLEPEQQLVHWACLGLGSNSNPSYNLPEAVRKLRREVEIDAVSSAWDSPAVSADDSIPDSPNYVNAAVLIHTPFLKNELIAILKRVENELGRTRMDVLNSLVTVDIDLLIYDGIVEKPDVWNLVYRAMPVGELLPFFISPETSEPLWTAAHRLAGKTTILPRFDLFRFPTSLKTS